MIDHSAADAAWQAAEALRLLNHSSLTAPVQPGIAERAEAYQIIGALGDVPPRLAQALNQVAGWLDAAQRAGQLDVAAPGGDPRIAVTAATWDLNVAADSLAVARDALRDVHVALGDLRPTTPVSSPSLADAAMQVDEIEPVLEPTNGYGRDL
jgi:hypothetical protein